MSTATVDRTGRWTNSLEFARRKAKKSQWDVAKHIGRNQNLISAIEKGKISGRLYMDEIATFLNVRDPSKIFPYYAYYTFEEAAERLGVSSTLISRRVYDGELPCKLFGEAEGAEKNVRTRHRKLARLRAQHKAGNLTDAEFEEQSAPYRGGLELIPIEALKGAQLRKRTGKSMRQQLVEYLTEENLTSVQLAEKFGPFDDDNHAASVRQNVQSILSRTKLPNGERQFVSERPTKLASPVWSLNTE